MSGAERTAAGVVRATALDGSLGPRVVGLAESFEGATWFAALVESGRAGFEGVDRTITGPALVWSRWPRGARVSFEAGCVGTYVLLGSTSLAEAIGHMPESRDFCDMADRFIAAPVDRRSETFAAMQAAFGGILREVRMRGPSANAAMEAYLRVVLVEFYRITLGAEYVVEQAAPSQRLFARFSALVEQHFRDRWSVNDYAGALGASRDRLGDVCQRIRGIGPKEMIDRRVSLEARLQLEYSNNSIQQIAGLLGFASPAQFNKFFRRTAGQPPGAFRSALRQNRAPVPEDRQHQHQWP